MHAAIPTSDYAFVLIQNINAFKWTHMRFSDCTENNTWRFGGHVGAIMTMFRQSNDSLSAAEIALARSVIMRGL
ncbi:MAG: hypothetical protein AAF307_02240 [Pseudomonadota bacterium]